MKNTNRIAKNTVLLYFRQILIMLVSLYTVRVVLGALGASDYGIYNVVAGLVVLFTFINTAMASSLQRFLNFYLGLNEKEKIQSVYSAGLLIHFGIVVLFLLIAETFGLWFCLNKLNIPENRSNIVFLVYQSAVFASVFKILKIPYQSVVIAFERMDFFAIISIVEVLLQLTFCFLLSYIKFDLLVFYSWSVTVTSFIITITFKIYCNHKFNIAHFKSVKDKYLFKELISFSGWSFFGAFANACNVQGLNLIINNYTNVIVNSAMGISNQVTTAVYSFYSNFQTAFNPQIVKSYSEGNRDYFVKLLYSAAKFSFILVLAVSLPLLLNIEFILKLWLGEYPVFAIDFIKLSFVCSLLDTFSGSLIIAIQATGNIKKYQTIVSFLSLIILPFSMLFLSMNNPPVCVLFVKICITVIILIWRIFYVCKRIGVSSVSFLMCVVARLSVLAFIAFSSSYLIFNFITNYLSSFLLLICSTGITEILIVFTVCLFGLDGYEKRFIKNIIASKLRK